MQKEIMIAVDDSRHSKNAVDYAVNLYQAVKEVKFTVMHVQPTISQYLLDEAKSKPQAYAELEKVNRKNAEVARDLLDKYKTQMVSAGVAEDLVQLKSQPRMLGIAKDVLQASTTGRFDALILGRRGLSGLQDMFIGSVSANIVNNSVDTPVWLVDEKGPSHDIMVAVDGSENSFKAVDHLAFIIEGSTDLKISFFHVAPRLQDFCPVEFEDVDSEALEQIILQGDQHCVDQFYAHAQKKLHEAGVQESQISFAAKEGVFRVGKAVLEEYRQGKFGTLVVGRRGVNKKFFTGSVSRYLINQFSNGALWVVP
ncbi:MAG: universal stress protein [Deltaproteobacteria bacterium]|jgi:nucleotide-binding universal stress UspA family protein|nr:universal stress protein [Deltaproteobacteria bacterium]